MYPCRRNSRAAFLILLILCAAFPYPAYDKDNPFIVVINPRAGRLQQNMKDWRMPFSRYAIREWGASRGMALLEDRDPVVDDTAAYVGPFGSSIRVSGFSRDARYGIWIDFVRFGTRGAYPDSVLKIYAAATGMEPRLVDAFRYSDIHNSYYHADLPAAVTSRGSAEIRFEEFSGAPGAWGVWDIIVTGAGELPRRSDIPGDEGVNLEINDRIVQ